MARSACALVIVVARVPIAIPACIAVAVVMTRPLVDANGVSRIAVVLVHFARVNLMLASFSLVGPAHTCASIVHVYAVAGPVADMVVACCPV